jgi:hypothetical protein
MNTFRKYSFGSKGAATTKINALGLDEDGNPTHKHAIVHLGNIVVTPATFDEEGNILTEAVLSDTYHIDVLWDGEPNPDWDNQMVWPNPNVLGLHIFGSSKAVSEYLAKAKELHPEYFPEPEELI